MRGRRDPVFSVSSELQRVLASILETNPCFFFRKRIMVRIFRGQ